MCFNIVVAGDADRGRSGESAYADVVKTRIRCNAEENAYLKVHYDES